MSLILVISIAIRFLALSWALWVWRRLRDWRIGFLTLMLLLMLVRQTWTLKKHTSNWHTVTLGGLDELPGLLVSILALLAVIFLERMLMESRRKAKEEQLFSAILRASLDDSPDFLTRALTLLAGFPFLPLQPRAAVWMREPEQSDYTLIASIGSGAFPKHPFSRCPLEPCPGGEAVLWQHRVDGAGEQIIEFCIQAGQSCGGWLMLYLKPGGRLHPRDYRLLEQVVILIGLSLARQRARRQLQYQARHDALTGLFNRYEFQERLMAAIDRASQGEHHVLGYFDLDQFKVVNDTCGHDAGDELLRQVAEILRSKVKPGDCVARFGGDEFALLLHHCDLDRAVVQVRQILQQLNRWRFLWKGRMFQIRASFGLVALEPGVGDWETVLGYADAACFMAKEYGRNRIQVYRSDDLALRQRNQEMNWVSRIEAALEQGHFRLYAQPIVSVQGNPKAVQHYEILLRLCGPTKEPISPAQFMPAAERYHLMSQIDRWVVKEALALLPRFPDHQSCFSINLSGQSLGDRELLTIIQQGCQRLAPGRLCFEITETAAISNLARARPFLESLKQMGCQLALDDFGTGLSSYAYLRHLPVDVLKIDGQFVRDICRDPVDLAMIRSINEVAHILGKRTVAEWVENRDVLEKLRELEVDYAQGYHLGEPLPLEQILQERPL